MNQLIPGVTNFQGTNPVLSSEASPFIIQFAQTRETLMDVEGYRDFLRSGISQFRKMRTYTHYKAYLMGLGLDRCQFHSNIKSSENREEKMAEIEMHHHCLTIFDIAMVITEHMLNTVGELTTMDLIHLLKKEHKENHIMLVMLSRTAHQLYHNTNEFFIHADMAIGDWATFLETYRYGITIDIANKIIWFLNTCIDKGESDDGSLLSLREKIKDWSYLNQQYGLC
jgi:hypothetical protein